MAQNDPIQNIAPRRWLQFSLRAFLVVVTVLCIWLAVEFNQASRQKAAVDALRAVGAAVYYDHQRAATFDSFDTSKELNVPEWLRKLAGDDFFQKVVRVDFAGNRTEEDLVHLQALPNIESLNFRATSGGRGITDAALAHLPHPERLVRFAADESAIGDGFLQRFANSSRLEALVLDDTSITPQGWAALGELPRLRLLAINDPKFGDEALADLPAMPSLDSLLLTDSSVTDAGLAHLARFETLKNLELRNARVSDAGLEKLSALPNLRSLSLEGTQVCGPGLRHVVQRISDSLNLSRTPIDDSGLAAVKGAKQLQSLNIEHTQVTDAGLEHLYGLRRLGLVCLEGTRVTPSGIKNLAKAAPTLGVVSAPSNK
jgi:hypothetical protein